MSIQTGVTRNNAMLFTYRISQVGKTKQHKEATRDLENMNNCEQGMTSATIKLFKPEDLAPMTTQISIIRKLIDEATMPWGYGNQKLIPSAKWSTFKVTLDNHIMELDRLVCNAADKLDDLINNARRSLQHLFVPANYTSRSEFIASYKVCYTISPIPSSDDFRVTENLDPADIAALKASMENDVKQFYAAAIKDAWDKINSVLFKFLEDLKSGKNPHDSTLDNIIEIAEALPSFNINNDPNMKKASDIIITQLSSFDMKAIRKDKEEREDAVDTLEIIMKKMEGFMSF